MREGENPHNDNAFDKFSEELMWETLEAKIMVTPQ